LCYPQIFLPLVDDPDVHGEVESCVFPAGHEGGHSFELAEVADGAPSSVGSFYLVVMGQSGSRY